MIAALRSETVKFRQRVYGIAVLGMLAFMAVTMVISVGDPAEAPRDLGPAGLVLSLEQLEAADGLGRSLGNAVTFLGIVALTLVAINVGGEYGYGAIRNLLLRQPNRARLFFGKTLALLAFLAGATVLAALLGAALGPLITGADPAAWGTGEGLAATAEGGGNLAAALLGWAALGILLAVVLRSAPAAIGVGVAYALPLEVLLTAVFEDSARWLPGQLFQALARGGTPQLDHTAALLGSLAWTAAALAAALVVFARRDVAD